MRWYDGSHFYHCSIPHAGKANILAMWSFQTGKAMLPLWRSAKSQMAQTRVVVWTAAQRPAELAVLLADRMLVDAGVAMRHQPVLGELPALVAVGPELLTALVVVLLGVADGNAVAG